MFEALENLVEQAAAAAARFERSRLALVPLASDPATDRALASALNLVAGGMDAQELAQAIAHESEIRHAWEKIRVALIATAVEMMFAGYPAPIIKHRLLALLDSASIR
jgi:hypothetical protein